jgi:hypothetical protein
VNKTNSPKLIQLTQSELLSLRERPWEKQGHICPILQQKIFLKDAVLDHKHKLKDELAGPDGKGLLRGVVHMHANIMEGKIARTYQQYHLDKFIPLPELLRNIADYIESPPMAPEFIHPNERPPQKILGKRLYNKVCKHYFTRYPRRKSIPAFPRKGKMTKEFEIIIKEMKDFL